MKTNMGDPHRNFVDFSHVPVAKRLTRMPVCIDPSPSVGSRDVASDGLLDVMHVTTLGIITGANMVLVDFHPDPTEALVDGPQAMLLRELPYLLEDISITRDAYLRRCDWLRGCNLLVLLAVMLAENGRITAITQNCSRYLNARGDAIKLPMTVRADNRQPLTVTIFI